MTASPILSITNELLADIVLECEDSDICQFGQYRVALPTAQVIAMVEHIRSLTGRLEKAESALRPFAKCAELFDDAMRSCNMPNSGPFYSWTRRHHEYELTVENLRSARAAIAQEGADHE